MKTLFCILVIAYILISVFLVIGSLLFCDKDYRHKALIVSIIPFFHLFPIIAMVKNGSGFNSVMEIFSYNLWESFLESKMIKDNTDYKELLNEYEAFLEENCKKREVHDR